ncbi:MAG: hypothetical protein MZV70_49150 [Desulfobacterales bacterium]|nr:hypothetical protein [Desulfobacterales bacterium]
MQKALTRKSDGFVLLLKHQPSIDAKKPVSIYSFPATRTAASFSPSASSRACIFRKTTVCMSWPHNKLLYVSRGTGTWGPPVRVFAPPEITVIDLIGKK